MRRIFTDKELNFIEDNYMKMTYRELTEKLNEFNDIKKSCKQVRTKASVMGLSKQKHNYNRRFFKKIDTQEKAYWLGFFFADGYIVRKERENGQSTSEVAIELNDRDIDHLIRFNSLLENGSDLKIKTQKSRDIKGVHVDGGKKTATLRYYSSEMYFDLVDKGVVQNKTYRPEFPKVEAGFFFNFLLGVIDGDGYITDTDNHLSIGIVNPNSKFLEYIQQVLSENEIKSSLYTEDSWKRRSVVYGESAEKLAKHLYSNQTTCLQRKRDVYLKHTNKTGLAS